MWEYILKIVFTIELSNSEGSQSNRYVVEVNVSLFWRQNVINCNTGAEV